MGLAFAMIVLSGCCTYLGKGLQKRGIQELPPISLEWSVFQQFLRSGYWGGGLFLELVGAILAILALARVPVSVVQPLLSTGLLALVVYAWWVLGERATIREGVGLCCLVGGTVCMALTLQPSERGFSWWALGGGMFSVALLLGFLEVAYRRGMWIELVTGVMSGICFSQATVLMRSAHLLNAQGYSLPWLLLGGFASLGASLTGVFLQTRGLRHGRAVLIVTYDTLASCVASLVVGMLVLAEPFPTDAQGIFLRILSLVLIFVGIPLLAQQQARLQGVGG